MKVTAASIVFTLILVSHLEGQINEGKIIVKSIRSVSWSRVFDEVGKEYDKRPGVEIELFTAQPNGFHLGTVNGEGAFIEHSPQCLQIGNLQPIVEGGSKCKPTPNNRTRFFVLTKDDWKRLKDGDALRLYYGCPKPSDDRLNSIGYLNKALLDKAPPKRCTLPIEFAPRLQGLGLGFHVARVYDRIMFNENRDSVTNVLTLSYDGPENATKLSPGERNYLRWQIEELKRDYPGILHGIQSMKIHVAGDLIYKLDVILPASNKNTSVRPFVATFADEWKLPSFWKYKKGVRKAEMTCADFRIEIAMDNNRPRLVIVSKETENKVKNAAKPASKNTQNSN